MEGNKTFIPEKYYDEIINYLKKRVTSSYRKSNVLYRGPMVTIDIHIETAKANGFTQIPIVIADGDIGTIYDDIKINKTILLFLPWCSRERNLEQTK